MAFSILAPYLREKKSHLGLAADRWHVTLPPHHNAQAPLRTTMAWLWAGHLTKAHHPQDLCMTQS